MQPHAFRLKVIEGPDAGTESPLSGTQGGRVLIGREVDPGRDLFLEQDLRVSRLHAVIEFSPDGIVLIDRSLNGTARNGQLLNRDEPVLLSDGDRLQIGPRTVVRFELLPVEARPSEDTLSERPPVAAIEPSERFGKFDVFQCVAQSTSDVVHRAVDRESGIEVALKRFTFKMMTANLRRSIREEVERAREWSHPGIAGLVDVGELDKVLYVVTRYIDGRSLESLAGTLSVEIDPLLGAYVIREACDAIGYLTEREPGFVHGQIGPRCFMVDRQGRVALINYGLRPFESRIGGATSGGRFQAKEAKDGKAVDARADVCSLGRILYELMGRVPVPKDALLPPLTTMNPDVPAALAEIADKASKWSLGQRYASAAVMRDALQRAMDSIEPGFGAQQAQAWMTRFAPPD